MRMTHSSAGRVQRHSEEVLQAGDSGDVGPASASEEVGDGLTVDSGPFGHLPQAAGLGFESGGEGTGDVLDDSCGHVIGDGIGPGFRIAGKLARRPATGETSNHVDALLSVKIGFDPFTGCLSSQFRWSVTLSPEVSRRIREYRPRLPQRRWAPVADLVRATVAASAPVTCYEAEHLMHVVGRLAVWADGGGLPRNPDVWMRTETIDAFVLSGCAGMDDSTVQTYRSWLRRVREALVWVQRGEAPPARLSSPRDPQPPYKRGELSRLRAWAAHLPRRARLDGLALMGLGAGCGLAPGEVTRVRGSHVHITTSGVAVLDEHMLGRLVACHVEWAAVLAELAETAGSGFVFRPGRKVAAAKNLVSSWPSRHRPHAGLPPLSARRLRSTWIVRLLADGISPAVVAQAAGMASTAALAPYHRWVPPLPREEVIRLLHGRRQ
jgi:integrase